MSQATAQTESETPDITMEEAAPNPAAAEAEAEAAKVNLEDIFDDDDDLDDEFTSSAPQANIKGEETSQQPAATLYASYSALQI